jgi:DNA-binding NarL/FixJ family response regulator
MSAHRTTRALLAARPGLMRNALTAYLRAVPGVSVDIITDFSEKILPAIAKHPPNTLILDADVVDDLAMLLRRLHTEQPNLNCIVLADSVVQREAALAAGADHVLLKGFLDERLGQAVLNGRASARPADDLSKSNTQHHTWRLS